jgi:head-tail adaptor
MQAGLLNRTIEVYKPVTLTNVVGSTTTEWAKLYSTRASVKQTSMGRSQELNEITYNINKEFIIRSYHKIHETYRIKFENNFYRIVSIDRRREYNDILITTEIVNE